MIITMKHIVMAAALALACGSTIHSQTVVDINLHQNPLFEVSTNSVNTAVGEGSQIVIGGDIVVKGGSGSYSYLWYTPDGFQLGTDPTITINEPGKYLLDITDSCDCLQTVEFNVGVASVDNIMADNVFISPNPTDGYIEFNGFEARQLTATSMAGELAYLIDENGAPFSSADLTRLAPGTYIIVLTDRQGNVFSTKLIKK